MDMSGDMDGLKKRREFLRAARARKAVRPGLVLQAYRRSADGTARVGYTATKKIGNAVARNLARRRLREAARQVLAHSGQNGFDYVLVARKVVLTQRFAEIVRDLKSALDDVHRHNGKPARAFG